MRQKPVQNSLEKVSAQKSNDLGTKSIKPVN